MDPELTLEKILLQTELPVQYDLALTLVEWTLPIWEAYAANESELSFYDGVGNHYQVNRDILRRTVEIIKTEQANRGTQTAAIGQLYDEFVGPILSINRMDWEPPEAADRAFCAAYNLVQLYMDGSHGLAENAQLNLVINHAAAALLKGNVKTLDELNQIIGVLRKNYHKPADDRVSESTEVRAPGKTAG